MRAQDRVARANALFELGGALDGRRSGDAATAEVEIGQVLGRAEAARFRARRQELLSQGRKHAAWWVLREMGFAHVGRGDSGNCFVKDICPGGGEVIIIAYRPGVLLTSLFLHATNLAPYDPTVSEGISLIAGEERAFKLPSAGEPADLLWRVRSPTSGVVRIQVMGARP